MSFRIGLFHILIAVVASCEVRVVEAEPAKRALVIGNPDGGAVRSVRHDSQRMCAFLKARGFETNCPDNLSDSSSKNRAKKFADSVKAGEVALVYFSGSVFRGRDGNGLTSADEAPLTIEFLTREVTSHGPQFLILILDAFRPDRNSASSPLISPTLLADANTQGSRVLVLYGLQQDSPDGSSQLTSRLLDELSRPGEPVESAFEATVSALRNSTGFLEKPTILRSGEVRKFAFSPESALSEDTARGEDFVNALRREKDTQTLLRLCDQFFREFPDHPKGKNVEELREMHRAQNSATPVEANRRTSVTEIRASDVAGMEESLEANKKKLGWEETKGLAREWWEAFEAQNKDNLPTVSLLTKELIKRKASIKEFFLAYVYSDANSVLDNLNFMTELRDATDAYQRLAASIGFGPAVVQNNIRKLLFTIPAGNNGQAAQDELDEWASTAEAEMDTEGLKALYWILTEAPKLGFNLTDIQRVLAGRPSNDPWPLMLVRLERKKTNPVVEESSYEIGKKLSDEGKHAEAIEILTQAISDDRTHAPAYHQRGYSSDALGKCPEAIRDYSKAISLNRTNAHAFASRGVCLYQSGYATGAIEDYHKAVELDKENGHHVGNLISGLIGMQLYEDAKAHMADQAVANRVRNEHPASASEYYAAVGDGKKARSIVDLVKEKAPDSASALNSRCWIYARTNAPEDAFEDCLAAWKKAPKDGNIIGSVAYARYKMGDDLGQAIREMDESNRLLGVSFSKPKQGEAYYFRGVIHDAMGNTTEAQADYAKAIELSYIITAHDRRLDVPRPDIIEKIKKNYPNSNLGTAKWGPPKRESRRP